MARGIRPKNEQDASTAMGSYWEDIERAMLRDRFGSIPVARRKELDRLCEPISTEAECEEHERKLLAEFERRIDGLSKKETDKLYHAEFCSVPPDGFALWSPEKPMIALEREYVEWRTDFNVYKERELVASQAIRASRENEALSAESQAKAKALAEAEKSNKDLTTTVQTLVNLKPKPKKAKKRGSGRNGGLKPWPATVEILKMVRTNLRIHKNVKPKHLSETIASAIRVYEREHGSEEIPSVAAIRRHLRKERTGKC